MPMKLVLKNCFETRETNQQRCGRHHLSKHIFETTPSLKVAAGAFLKLAQRDIQEERRGSIFAALYTIQLIVYVVCSVADNKQKDL